MSEDRLELDAHPHDDVVHLTAPAVGLFTSAVGRGSALAAGQPAGILLRLGRATTLVVPAGVAGTVVSDRPERVHAPVGYGEVLYELTRGTAAETTATAATPAAADSGALVVRSPQSGRFYHRSGPDAPAFVEPGTRIEAGAPIGLIEVMKTFTHVPYQPIGGLPPRGRVVRLLVPDGGDVREGDPLLEVEAI